MNEQVIVEQKLSAAEKYYMNHKKNVAKYQKQNPEKCKIKNKRHTDKMRSENPETYDKLRLEYGRNYYQNVRKPKDMALKALKKLKAVEEKKEDK
jgi:hypothetical protein